MSEENPDWIYDVRMSIDRLDSKLEQFENNLRSWKGMVLKQPFMLSGNRALKIMVLIEKLEQKIINEDYSDLLLLIKKIKEMIK